MRKKDPMLDRDFLQQLDEYNLREVYAKVIAINFDEQPQQELTGIVQSGSINIDGKSAVRRTCNVTLTTNQAQTRANIDWALRTKFKLYIGLKNFINPEYDDIIYFKMGTFVLTSYNTSFNTSGYTITIQGRDKMCLLNGDVGGSLMAETDFGIRWEQIPNTNRYDKYDIPIKTIIREAIHEYAQEPYSNIIINDLNTCGVELIAYRAHNNPIYVYEMINGDSVIQQMCFENSDIGNALATGTDKKTGKPIYQTIKTTVNGKVVETKKYQGDGYTVHYNDRDYKILKRADYGETIGFRATDLTYAGDLIASVGESVTSVLDKIVKMLGDFEYYYDIDGHFIFQRKKVYYNTSWSNAKVSTEDNGYTGTEYYYDSTISTSAETYSFYGGKLVESYSNQPKLTDIRNDYSIWGTIKGISKELPIHLRCAIDLKPSGYISQFREYLKGLLKENISTSDFARYDFDPENPNYMQRLLSQYDYSQRKANREYIETLLKKYSIQAIHDMKIVYDPSSYDWRELIYQMAEDSFNMRGLIEEITKDLNNPSRVFSTEAYNRITSLLADIEDMYSKNLDLGYSHYYTDLLAFWRGLYRTSREPHIVYKYDEKGNIKEEDGILQESETKTFTQEEWLRWQANGYWNPNCCKYDQVAGEVTVFDPSEVIFWFDFLDPMSDLMPYSIPMIGRRPKVVNDNTIKSIFVRDTPNVLFVDPNADLVQYEKDLHYIRLNVPTIYSNYFSMSAQGKSAKEELDQVIYDSTYYQDTISISAIPVYYLEPNTRIKVYDENTGIDGDYLINSLAYSVAHDGMMTIQATRAEQRIL